MLDHNPNFLPMNTRKLYFLTLLLSITSLADARPPKVVRPVSTIAPSDQHQRSSSPYYINNWIKGQITFDGGTEHEYIPLKYNVYDNQLVVRQDGEPVTVKRDEVRGFIIGPASIGNLARFQKAQYIDNFDVVPQEQFVQLIYQSESKLLAVHKKEQLDSAESKYSETQTTFYYMSPEGEVTAFEPGKETMLKLFADKRAAVQQFIEEEKIDFDSIQDITTVVAFYDSTGEDQ